MHCSLENRNKNRTKGGREGRSDSKLPDNKRTSEQTGLTAGPGSAREAVNVTRARGERVRKRREEGVSPST